MPFSNSTVPIDPGTALLRYAPGASVPLHLHTGLETIFVLEGRQSDEAGTYQRGSVVLNREGSSGDLVIRKVTGPVPAEAALSPLHVLVWVRGRA